MILILSVTEHFLFISLESYLCITFGSLFLFLSVRYRYTSSKLVFFFNSPVTCLHLSKSHIISIIDIRF